MVNYNSLSHDDPEPESYHDGFGEKKRKKKQRKTLAGAALVTDQAGVKRDESRAIAEKSRPIFDQILKLEKKKSGEAPAASTDSNEYRELIPDETTRDMSTVHHGSLVVSAEEAALELQKAVESTKHVEDYPEDSSQMQETQIPEFDVDPSQDPEYDGSSDLPNADTRQSYRSDEDLSARAPKAASGLDPKPEASSSDQGAARSGRNSSGTGTSSGGTRKSTPPTTSSAGSGAGSGGAGSSGARPPYGYGLTPPVSPPGSGGSSVYRSRGLTPPVSVETAEDAYRRGRRKGIVAGLLVGGGVEHFRHKRREKRMTKKFESEKSEQKKQYEKAAEDTKWDSIREKQNEKIRAETAAKFAKSNPEQSRLGASERPHVSIASKEEARERAELIAHQLDSAKRTNRPEVEAKEVARLTVLTKIEQTEVDRQREQIELAQGHRIERSAWHNIEVDQQGKAVQSGSLEYGHEYYREKAKETIPVSKHQLDEAAGEVALVAAAMNEASTRSEATSRAPSSKRKSTLRPSGLSGGFGVAGMSASNKGARADDESVRQPLLRAVTTPPTTTAGTIGWFAALIVLIVIFAFIAR